MRRDFLQVSAGLMFQFQVNGGPAGYPAHYDWREAAIDVINSGMGAWVEEGVIIEVDDSLGACIERIPLINKDGLF